MKGAALALWVMTALGGLTMAGMWLANGGPTQHRDGHSRISAKRIGLHVSLAATGLVLWIVYVATDGTTVGWLAFVLLPIAGLVGFLMFLTWLAGRGAASAGVVAAEQKFPPLLVAAHGLLAVLTVGAVLIAVL